MPWTVLLLTACILALCQNAIAGPSDSTATSKDIRIMTYNVKLLPRGAVYLDHHPVKRARLIPAKVIQENPDAVVFEEAFDGKAVRILTKKMKEKYPYMAGKKNRRLITYKRAGGVLIFSKYPMKELESIRYSQSKGIDRYGNKGAMLVEIEHPAHKIQLLGTHLQAGGSPDLKSSQYVEAAELLNRHQQEGIPQFVAGDFNTHKDDTVLYNKLVQALKAVDGDVDDELKVLMDHTLNDMRSVKKGKPKKKRSIIDYVFVKANGVKVGNQSRYAREYKQQWSKTHQDLSDHFAVVLKISML